MNMHRYPSHLDSYVEMCGTCNDEYCTQVKVSCQCGYNYFFLYQSNRKAVHAVCASCLFHVEIYELAHYPAATEVRITYVEIFAPIEKTALVPRLVYMEVEYGEVDSDEEFDRDDITWRRIYVKIDGRLFEVFSDETA